MGYDISLVFDPAVIDTAERAFVEVLAAEEEIDADAEVRAGFARLLSESEEKQRGASLFLQPHGCPFDIRFDGEEGEKSGRWAHVRLSWGLGACRALARSTAGKRISTRIGRRFSLRRPTMRLKRPPIRTRARFPSRRSPKSDRLLEAHEARKVFETLMGLADKAGCRLHDGRRYLDSVEVALESFLGTASSVCDLLGTVQPPDAGTEG